MAGIILNGSVIKGLILNGSPVTAILDGVKVFPVEEPTPQYDLILEEPAVTYSKYSGDKTVSTPFQYNDRYVCLTFGIVVSTQVSNGLCLSIKDVNSKVFSLYNAANAIRLNGNDYGHAGSNMTADEDGTVFGNGNVEVNTAKWYTPNRFKFIFDTTDNKVHFYVNDLKVCHGDYDMDLTSLTFYLFTDMLGGTFGPFDVYESNDFSALEAV